MAEQFKSSKASKERAAPKNTQIDTKITAAPNIQIDTMITAAPNMDTQEGASITNRVIVEDNTESRLLKLPAEIKQKIWILAITVDESIEPVQLRERSNKFIWCKAQHYMVILSKAQLCSIIWPLKQNTVTAVLLLTVVALSKVCRKIYEEVALTHLFYKVNRFSFTAVHRYPKSNPITYLVALTTPRMQALRSITCDWPEKREAPKMFAVLAACTGLQNVKIVIHGTTLWPNLTADLGKVPGFKDALIAVEGLQTLQLEPCHCVSFYQSVGQSLINKLDPLLKEWMKQPRGASKCNLDAYVAAQRGAMLDIWGDGRLGEDKKPSVVASRTRNQLRKLETLDDEGTIPKSVISKYDADGDLAWSIRGIMDSRRYEPAGFPSSVEFKVRCVALNGPRNWNWSGLPEETSWEDVNILNNYRGGILEFYRKYPGAYGMEAVVEAWELRDQGSGKTAKELKALRATTDSLIVLANRQEKIEERQAGHAAKLAANQARETAKAAKQAKKGTKKGKKTNA